MYGRAAEEAGQEKDLNVNGSFLQREKTRNSKIRRLPYHVDTLQIRGVDPPAQSEFL